MRWLVAIPLLGACYSPPSLHCAIQCNSDEGCPSGLACVGGMCSTGEMCGPRDAGDDDVVRNEEPTTSCYGIDEPPFARICVPAITVPGTRAINAAIDTSEETQCLFRVPQSGGQEICVIVADVLSTTNTTIRVTGLRPLALIGRTSLTIDGIIDLAGRQADSTAGPFPADANHCTSSMGENNPGAAGGAPGASGNGAGGPGGPAAAGGTASGGSVSPSYLRGGCVGGRGGNSGAGSGGLGGSGGGAVYMLSPSLVIDGVVNASGGGGRRAGSAAGGGGGGAGGMILLWSSQQIMIDPAAQLFALGGGGSTGGAPAADGVAGTDPTGPTSPSVRIGDAASGYGGRGGTRTDLNGEGGGTGINGMGGGGGGGADGFIKMRPKLSLTGSQFAPVPD